jgi:hypothetical protein
MLFHHQISLYTLVVLINKRYLDKATQSMVPADRRNTASALWTLALGSVSTRLSVPVGEAGIAVQPVRN